MGELFGTDGVRGEYGKEITDEKARMLAYYGTSVLTSTHKPVILIGRDTRESGPNLEKALVEGISLAGGKALLAGVIPTPAVAVLTKALGADAGIVVSASHNVFSDNGIKFFNKDGFKLSDEIEEKIEDGYFKDPDKIKNKKIDKDILNFENLENPEEIYLNFLNAKEHKNLEGIKIVLDCSNGASYKVAPEYFKSLGADVITIYNEPNGKNINDNCGSTHMKNVCNEVVKNNADFGFAFDGDADRCLAIDEKGNIINGDKIMYLMGTDLKEKGLLKGNSIVMTHMSNIGLREALEKIGIDYEVVEVGDRYVLEEMLNKDFILGGEQSGHIINLNKNTTGDGLLTASYLADIFKDKKTSELSTAVNDYPQKMENAIVSNEVKYTYLDYPEIRERIKYLEEHFKDFGDVYIRPSGTEAYVRVTLQGPDKEDVDSLAIDTARLIEKILNRA